MVIKEKEDFHTGILKGHFTAVNVDIIKYSDGENCVPLNRD